MCKNSGELGLGEAGKVVVQIIQFLIGSNNCSCEFLFQSSVLVVC